MSSFTDVTVMSDMLTASINFRSALIIRTFALLCNHDSKAGLEAIVLTSFRAILLPGCALKVRRKGEPYG